MMAFCGESANAERHWDLIATPPVEVETLRQSTEAWGRGKLARVCAESRGAMRVAWFTAGVAGGGTGWGGANGGMGVGRTYRKVAWVTG